MSKSNYRDLVVWQKSQTFVGDVYRISRMFPREEMFGLCAQMRRAAISIPCNIAESQGRRSRRDMIHFLVIARGSVLELETQFLIAVEPDFIESEAAAELIERALEIGRMLNGLINYLNKH